uniref:Transmembrane protein n=1 Tax=Syphacia muris TaxID=451379 RepID=A0A0N5ATM1_9BILA
MRSTAAKQSKANVAANGTNAEQHLTDSGSRTESQTALLLEPTRSKNFALLDYVLMTSLASTTIVVVFIGCWLFLSSVNLNSMTILLVLLTVLSLSITVWLLIRHLVNDRWNGIIPYRLHNEFAEYVVSIPHSLYFNTSFIPTLDKPAEK